MANGINNSSNKNILDIIEAISFMDYNEQKKAQAMWDDEEQPNTKDEVLEAVYQMGDMPKIAPDYEINENTPNSAIEFLQTKIPYLNKFPIESIKGWDSSKLKNLTHRLEDEDIKEFRSYLPENMDYVSLQQRKTQARHQKDEDWSEFIKSGKKLNTGKIHEDKGGNQYFMNDNGDKAPIIKTEQEGETTIIHFRNFDGSIGKVHKAKYREPSLSSSLLSVGDVATDISTYKKLIDNPIINAAGDVATTIFGDLRESVQELGYSMLNVDKITGESYDEFMYPNFDSIDDEIKFLENQQKFYASSLGLSVVGADIGADVAGAGYSISQGQPGAALEFATDAALIGPMAAGRVRSKYFANQRKLNTLKNKRKALSINNKNKAPVKKYIEKELNKSARKAGHNISNVDTKRAIKYATKNILSSTKFNKLLKNNGIESYDKIIKEVAEETALDILKKGNRHTRRAARKYEIKTGRQRTFTSDLRKNISKFLNNTPFFSTKFNKLNVWKDAILASKYGKFATSALDMNKRAWRYGHVPMKIASPYLFSTAYMAYKYGEEGIYDYSDHSAWIDVAAMPFAATYDFFKSQLMDGLGTEEWDPSIEPYATFIDPVTKEQKTVYSKEYQEFMSNQTAITNYFNQKKIDEYNKQIEESLNNAIVKANTGNQSKTATVSGPKTQTNAQSQTFDMDSFISNAITNNPSLNNTRIMNQINKYEEYLSNEQYKEADDLIKNNPFLAEYIKQKYGIE